MLFVHAHFCSFCFSVCLVSLAHCAWTKHSLPVVYFIDAANDSSSSKSNTHTHTYIQYTVCGMVYACCWLVVAQNAPLAYTAPHDVRRCTHDRFFACATTKEKSQLRLMLYIVCVVHNRLQYMYLYKYIYIIYIAYIRVYAETIRPMLAVFFPALPSSVFCLRFVFVRLFCCIYASASALPACLPACRPLSSTLSSTWLRHYGKHNW